MKKTLLELPESLHKTIKLHAMDNNLTIVEAINKILKNYFRSGKSDTDDLLSREEVKEVFESCLNRLK